METFLGDIKGRKVTVETNNWDKSSVGHFGSNNLGSAETVSFCIHWKFFLAIIVTMHESECHFAKMNDQVQADTDHRVLVTFCFFL